jgi:putative ABC transport system permease protein
MITLPIGPIFRAIRHHKGAVGLMICEVAAGLAVSVHTYLLGAWYLETATAPTGFDAPNLLVVTSEFEAPMPDAPASIAGQASKDVDALRRMPGVQAAAGANEIPLNRTYPRLVTSEGAPERDGLAWIFGVNAGAIEALGLHVIEGRAFAPEDVDPAPSVRAEDPEPIVISEPLAQELFPGRSAVGERIRVRRRHRSGVVVGVVAPFRAVSVNVVDARAALFLAEPPPADRSLRYVVRTEPGAAAAAAAQIPAALEQSGAARVTEVRGIADGEALGSRSNRYAHGIAMFMVGAIFFVVLLGRLGMSSFLVAEQTRAIGIRRALGARRRDVIAQLLLENAIYTTLGLLAGIPLLFVIAHLGRRAQRDVAVDVDFIVVAAAWLVFWATGLAGALVPALRAARLEPTVATRVS